MTDILREEHQALRATARRERRAFQRSPEGSMARQMEDAMTAYHTMRAEGVSRDDAIRGLAFVLRECIPCRPPRACTTCDGTGYRETVCTYQVRCGRYRCSQTEPAYEHPYVVPCDCPAGDRMREKARTQEDALAAVGKTQSKKRGGFSRMGQ